LAGESATGAGPPAATGTDEPAPGEVGLGAPAPRGAATPAASSPPAAPPQPTASRPPTEPADQPPPADPAGRPAPDAASAGEGAATDGLGDAVRPGTGEVTATVIVNAPAERVFAALLDWERQSDWIPFTRVRLVDGDGGVGSSIEAVTQVGPAVLRDEMRVVKVDRPYEIRVVHYGKVLRGPGVLRCTPMGGDRTQVVWHEWFHLPGGPAAKLAWPLLWPGSKVSLTQALRRFARIVEADDHP
jgi:uncharacterized membrane protein